MHTPIPSSNKSIQLFDDNGVEYTVVAARKELLKLFFELEGNKEFGVLNRLRICPRLLLLYNVNGDNRTVVANTYESCRCDEYYKNDDRNAAIRLYDANKQNTVSPIQVSQSNNRNDTIRQSPLLNASINNTSPSLSQPNSAASMKSPLQSSMNDYTHSNEHNLLSDSTQHPSINSLSVQLPNAGSQRYVTSLKNQIVDLNEQLDQLRVELEDQKNATAHWKSQWSAERNNAIKIWDRLDGLKKWLNRGFQAVPAPASAQLYHAPTRKNIPKSNINEYIVIDNSAEQQLRLVANQPIRTTEESRTVTTDNIKHLDPLANQPSSTNPVHLQPSLNTDNSLLADDVMSINQATPTGIQLQAMPIDPVQHNVTPPPALPINFNQTI